MIAPRHAAVVAHPLLHHAPLAGRGEEERVMVELVAILDRRAVDLGDHLAGIDQRLRVPAAFLARALDLSRRLARGRALAVRREEADAVVQISQPFFDRAADRRRHPARVPIEAEHAAERLKPMGIGQAAEHLRSALFRHQVRHDLARQHDHAGKQPGGSPARMQRQRGEARMARHAGRIAQNMRYPP